MRTFTVDKLITRAKYAADMEGQSFISPEEWKTLLSTAYSELYSIIVESGMRFYESELTITSDASGSYALPEDFLTVVGVDYEVNSNNGERRQLEPLMVQERNVFTGVGASTESTHYSLVGDNLKLYPDTTSGQTYYLVYVPQPEDLSDADDNKKINVVTPDGEAFLTWWMAFRALAKEESDVSVAHAEREDARERVYNWAALRALHEPRRRIVQQNIAGVNTLDAADHWGRGGGNGWGW